MFLPPSSATVELLFKEKENKNINKSDKKEIAKDPRLNLKKEKNLGKVSDNDFVQVYRSTLEKKILQTIF